MTPLARRLFLLFAALSGLTGAVYGVMRYWPLPEDGTLLVAHPSQPHWQHGHILLSAGLAMLIGYVAGVHALPYRAAGKQARHKTGGLLLWTAAPMVFSGFALQISVNQAWRAAWSVAHIVTGLLWLAALGAHLLTPRAKGA